MGLNHLANLTSIYLSAVLIRYVENLNLINFEINEFLKQTIALQNNNGTLLLNIL